MRRITERMKDAWDNGRSINLGNTMVLCGMRIDGTPSKSIHLFGNEIVWLGGNNNKFMCFSMAGHPTNTTKERLKGVGVFIYTQMGRHYFRTWSNVEQKIVTMEIDPNARYMWRRGEHYPEYPFPIQID